MSSTVLVVVDDLEKCAWAKLADELKGKKVEEEA